MKRKISINDNWNYGYVECLKCKNNLKLKKPSMTLFYKIIGENENGKIRSKAHWCCNKCLKDFESDNSINKLLEKIIIENYNEFLKTGINGKDIKKYYNNLHKMSIQKYEDMIYDALHEIYEDENDESSYILK